MPLLAADEPSPVTILREQGTSDIVLTADHAGRLIPRALRQLGVPDAEMERHAAGDGRGGELGQALRLVLAQGQALAGGRGDDHAVDRMGEQMADQPRERGVVDAAVAERRDQRNPEAA